MSTQDGGGSEQAAERLPGNCPENLELLEKLGKGSYGSVFKARVKKTGEIVAAKDRPDLRAIEGVAVAHDLCRLLELLRAVAPPPQHTVDLDARERPELLRDAKLPTCGHRA